MGADLKARTHEEVRTIWISDMSGFTSRTRRLGPYTVMEEIREMRRIVIPTLRKWGGSVFKVDADNLYALFDSPLPSLLASFDAHRALPDHTKICIGIGHGTMVCFEEENDYYGLIVNIASKLGEDTAGPGETLVSQAALDLLSPQVRNLAVLHRIEIGGDHYRYGLFDSTCSRETDLKSLRTVGGSATPPRGG